MIRMVVFDMAGTSVDEDNVVYKMLQKAINEKGFDLTLEQVLAEGAGKEKLQAVKSILGTYAGVNDDAVAQPIFERFLVLLKEAYDDIDVQPQPNALEVFHALKSRGIRVILNTGYNNKTAESLVEKLGWVKGTDFDGLVTANDVDKNRPNPDMIWYAMKQFGITDAKEVIKVGDSIIDIEEGKNAGCIFSIGITTGAHTFAQLQSANPDQIINNLLELLPIISKG